MNYQETRDNEQLRFLDEAITEFIKNRPPQSQTIIFFSGGLASRLLRAKTPYDANISAPQSFDLKPDGLPIQTPTKYELAINLKTAKALGMTVSPV